MSIIPTDRQSGLEELVPTLREPWNDIDGVEKEGKDSSWWHGHVPCFLNCFGGHGNFHCVPNLGTICQGLCMHL